MSYAIYSVKIRNLKLDITNLKRCITYHSERLEIFKKKHNNIIKNQSKIIFYINHLKTLNEKYVFLKNELKKQIKVSNLKNKITKTYRHQKRCSFCKELFVFKNGNKKYCSVCEKKLK